MIRKLIALAAALALLMPAPAAASEGAPIRSATQQSAADLYVERMTEILDVPEVDREASLAGGRNACHWISAYGLDPETLAGWQDYWSEPWEYEWLRAAATYICPG